MTDALTLARTGLLDAAGSESETGAGPTRSALGWDAAQVPGRSAVRAALRHHRAKARYSTEREDPSVGSADVRHARSPTCPPCGRSASGVFRLLSPVTSIGWAGRAGRCEGLDRDSSPGLWLW